MSIFTNSEIIFLNIINKYDIILDDDYKNIKDYYYNKNYNNKYNNYFDLFNNYYHLKNDINIIYYIILLFYIDEKLLINFIRFYTSKLLNYEDFDISNKKIITFDKLKNLNKMDLISYLKKIIDTNYKFFLFFILCFQIYF
tara:strand:+ start:10099 stop:10521 length:423 start_codon:yes stop_codon:yes gene_type:complete